MDNVQILKDLGDVRLPKIPEDTFVIYKEGYDIPDVNCTEKFTFREYKEEYHNLHINMLIIFGTNRIITPSNRTDFIFEHLFTLTNGTPKISVDYLPFIGEPWRCWFHYGITNSGNFGIPYSYTIETEWQHWFYRKRQDSRFQKDNLKTVSYTHLTLPTTPYV